MSDIEVVDLLILGGGIAGGTAAATTSREPEEPDRAESGQPNAARTIPSASSKTSRM